MEEREQGAITGHEGKGPTPKGRKRVQFRPVITVSGEMGERDVNDIVRLVAQWIQQAFNYKERFAQ